MVIYPCHLAGFIASQTGHHPQAVHRYLVGRLPLGCNYLTPKETMALLRGYGATLPVEYKLAAGYLHL
jgi:hypothetical protein